MRVWRSGTRNIIFTINDGDEYKRFILSVYSYERRMQTKSKHAVLPY